MSSVSLNKNLGSAATAMDAEPTTVSSNLERLPQELFQKMISYLGTEVTDLSCVNREISQRRRGELNFKEFVLSQKFIEFLIEELTIDIQDMIEEPQQLNIQGWDQIKLLDKMAVKSLQKILGRINSTIASLEKDPRKFLTPEMLEKEIVGLRAQLIHVIKTLDLDHDTKNRLAKKAESSEFFYDIFDLAETQKTIDYASLLNNNDLDKWIRLSKISQAFAEKGYIDKALQIAQGIPENNDMIKVDASSQRKYAISCISKKLVDKGCVDRAIAVLQLISNQDCARDFAIANLSKTLIDARYVKESIKLAKTITNPWIKYNAFDHISRSLVKVGKFDEGIECTRLILDPGTRARTLNTIYDELQSAGQVDQAIVVSELTPEERRDVAPLYDLFLELMNKCEFSKARKVAELMPDREDYTRFYPERGRGRGNLTLKRFAFQKLEKSAALRGNNIEASFAMASKE